MYNQMTCSGWGEAGLSFLGPCSMAWVGLVIVVFLVMVLRRQCDDGILAGTGFNVFGAAGLGISGNILVTILLGSARWSVLAGVIGVIVGGYVFGLILGGSESGGY